jgi:hypothetical protein
VTIRNRKKTRSAGRAIALTTVALTCAFAGGCSMLKKSPPPASAIGVEDQTPMPASPTSIQIAYAKPDDTLQSLVVSQFTGANVLRTVSQGDGEASVLRFDGGVPIWKFHANRTLLNPLTKIKQAPYHVLTVDYGKVPPGFLQDAPEVGPPPPLDIGGYYIFAIERASGATSYQAVRVKSDLTLQAYDAEPRAGTSYQLCCDVSADFAQPTPDHFDPPGSAPSTDSSPDSSQP